MPRCPFCGREIPVKSFYQHTVRCQTRASGRPSPGKEDTALVVGEMIRVLDEKFYPLWMKLVPLVPAANLVAHDILEEIDEERKKTKGKTIQTDASNRDLALNHQSFFG